MLKTNCVKTNCVKTICVATRVIFKSMVMLATTKLTPYLSDVLHMRGGNLSKRRKFRSKVKPVKRIGPLAIFKSCIGSKRPSKANRQQKSNSLGNNRHNHYWMSLRRGWINPSIKCRPNPPSAKPSGTAYDNGRNAFVTSTTVI